MEQTFLFDMPPQLQPRPVHRPVRRVRLENDGPSPQQRELNLRKLLRKIAFRHRTREAKGVGNHEVWEADHIVRLQRALCEDWETRFPFCVNPAEQLDWWLWMMGDDTQAFSFRHCLLANGYTRPDEVIEACEANAPHWFRTLLELPDDQRPGFAQSLLNGRQNVVAPRRMLDTETLAA